MMILICRQGFLRFNMDSTETALHEFVRRIELSLAKKRTALGIPFSMKMCFELLAGGSTQ